MNISPLLFSAKKSSRRIPKLSNPPLSARDSKALRLKKKKKCDHGRTRFLMSLTLNPCFFQHTGSFLTVFWCSLLIREWTSGLLLAWDSRGGGWQNWRELWEWGFCFTYLKVLFSLLCKLGSYVRFPVKIILLLKIIIVGFWKHSE